MIFVYQLFDNIYNVPIYIGATIDLRARMRAHLCTTLKEYPNRLAVRIIILEETTSKNAKYIEQKWYEKHISEGVVLLNKSNQRFYNPNHYVVPENR